MYYLISDLNSVWVLAALVPLGVIVAAWALQMACGFCSIEPPEFGHAVTTIAIIALANVALKLVLQETVAISGMGTQYLLPAVVTAAVIALRAPTGPLTATAITVVGVVLCGLIYFGVDWLVALAVHPFMV